MKTLTFLDISPLIVILVVFLKKYVSAFEVSLPASNLKTSPFQISCSYIPPEFKLNENLGVDFILNLRLAPYNSLICNPLPRSYCSCRKGSQDNLCVLNRLTLQ